MSQQKEGASILPSLILAVLATAYVWISYDYDGASQAMPWMAGILAIALSLIDIAARSESAAGRRFRRLLSGSDRQEFRGLAEPARIQYPLRKEAAAIGWVAAFVGLVVILGFYAAIPLYVFSYLRLYAGKGGLVSAATAFGLVGFLYMVFEVFMGYEIFGGLLVGDAM